LFLSKAKLFNIFVSIYYILFKYNLRFSKKMIMQWHLLRNKNIIIIC
jgi:hypothetical protein